MLNPVISDTVLEGARGRDVRPDAFGVERKGRTCLGRQEGHRDQGPKGGPGRICRIFRHHHLHIFPAEYAAFVLLPAVAQA